MKKIDITKVYDIKKTNKQSKYLVNHEIEIEQTK